MSIIGPIDSSSIFCHHDCFSTTIAFLYARIELIRPFAKIAEGCLHYVARRRLMATSRKEAEEPVKLVLKSYTESCVQFKLTFFPSAPPPHAE